MTHTQHYQASAWVLYPNGHKKSANGLVREKIVLSSLTGNEVLAQPVFGCWEANMSHALEYHPIDTCRYRAESKVVIGNAGVARILEVGNEVKLLRPGQHAIISPNGIEDKWGYTVRALGYDAPGRSGALATLIKLTERQAIPIPEPTKYSLAQWAAFSARYVTAWSNWELAMGVFRLQVPEHECPQPHVWGWGGGTTLAELDLARRRGCKTAMLSGTEENLRSITQLGIRAVDRREFAGLAWDEEHYLRDSQYRHQYNRAETLFLKRVRELTNNEMVQIFIDYIGGPVYRATLKALSREGVITTAGWKKGMKISHLRAEECISRHQHIYTHYAKYSQGVEAIAYAEATGWMPDQPQRIYSFEEIPELINDYSAGRAGYFPCFSITT